MTKKELIKKLVAAEIDHDPKATNAELEKLLPAGGDAPKEDEGSHAPPEEKTTAKVVTRKIESAKELLQLQKDGRLEGYDPATGIGKVLSVGNKKIKWPKVSEEKK